MAQAAPYTVLKLITRSLRLLGFLNEGDAPTAQEIADGLEALNAMVDSWALLRLMIYSRLRLVLPLNAGQASYEIGPKAVDWVCQRPVFIDGAGILYPGGNVASEQEVHVCTPDEWRLESVKTLSGGGQIVTKIFYDYGFSGANTTGATDVGSGRIFIYPVVTGSGSLVLYLPQAVSEFVSIAQTLALPPGYRRALVYNLAVEYAAEFSDVTPNASVVAIAAASLENIMRANVHLSKLRLDLPGSAGRFNIYTGQ